MEFSSVTTQVIKIFLVDDHPLVRDGLRSRINRHTDMQVCGEADDVASAWTAINDEQPDVAIVDLSLKSGSGIDLITRLAASQSPVKIVVSSMHDEHLYAERVIKAGAHGYVQKENASENIVAAIRHVVQGKLFLSDEINSQLMRRVVGNAETTADPITRLTNRELQVFERLGYGDSVKDIAQSLSLSPKTIETYRDRIRRKLDVSSSTHLMRYAIKWVDGHMGR